MTCTHKTKGLRPADRFLVDILIEQGGVYPEIAHDLRCPDVHMMVRVLARSNYTATADRRLLIDEYPPVEQYLTSVRRWNDWSWATLVTLCALALAGALWLICSPVWRTFS